MMNHAVQSLAGTDAEWMNAYYAEDYKRLHPYPQQDTDEQVDFLMKELTARVPALCNILDLGCGHGRHAIALAKRGFNVVGLDYQEPLLRQAAIDAAAAEVQLALVHGDMRQLEYDAAFDAVICLFGVIGAFSDEDTAPVFAEIAQALRPHGCTVIDIANRDLLVRQAHPRGWKRLPDGGIVISEWAWDVRTGRYTHDEVLIDLETNSHRTFTHSLRVYTCTELCSMIRAAGLVIDGIYGGYHGEALTLEAPRLLIIARKDG